MLHFWKGSTVMFVLQCALGGMAYYLTADLEYAIRWIGVVLMFAPLIGSFLHDRGEMASIGSGVSAPFCLLILYDVARSTDESLSMLIIAMAIYFVAMHIFLVKVIGEPYKDSFLACFIAALPLGFGTVLGGMILLARRAKPAAAT